MDEIMPFPIKCHSCEGRNLSVGWVLVVKDIPAFAGMTMG